MSEQLAIIETVTDLSTPDYPGPGVGITDTCGLCHLTFDLTAEPDQYPTLVNDLGDPEELICDSCQDLMEADEAGSVKAEDDPEVARICRNMDLLAGLPDDQR